MILNDKIITDIKIQNLNDLYKLKHFFENGTLKINKSQIAQRLYFWWISKIFSTDSRHKHAGA